MCLSVRQCVYQSRACSCDNSSPVQARINKFEPEVPNTLVKSPIVFGADWSWLQGQIYLESQILPNFKLVHVISLQWFKLSPNLNQKSILALLKFILILDLIGLVFQFHFYLKPVLVIPGRFYSHNTVTQSATQVRSSLIDGVTVPWTHYVSNNCIYFSSHLLCLSKLNCSWFNHYERSILSQRRTPATICLFSSCDYAMNLHNDFCIPHVPENT